MKLLKISCTVNAMLLHVQGVVYMTEHFFHVDAVIGRLKLPSVRKEKVSPRSWKILICIMKKHMLAQQRRQWAYPCQSSWRVTSKWLDRQDKVY